MDADQKTLVSLHGSCPRGCVDTDGCGCEWNATRERGTLNHSPDQPLASVSFTDLHKRYGEAADDLVGRLIDAMSDLDTETLRGIVEYRERLNRDCWMARLVREYLAVWR